MCIGKTEVYFHSFLNCALDGVSGQLHVLAALPLGNNYLPQFNRTFGAPPPYKLVSRFREEKNLSLLPRIEPGSSRPENSHCTDRATPDAGVILAIV